MPNDNRDMVVVIGATSGIAKSVMRKLVSENKYNFSLVGRCEKSLNRIKKDLEIREPSTLIRLFCSDDLSNVDFINSTARENKSASMVFICVGMLPNQDQTQRNLSYLEQSIQINSLIPILWLEAFAASVDHSNTLTIGIMSSVAADRGRKSNYCYGAAKSLLDTYVQGMQHRFYKTNKKLVLIKPGPTKSPMTQHISADKLADPDKVAEDILKAMHRKKPVVYTPKKWWLIMRIIKMLPRQIFNRINI